MTKKAPKVIANPETPGNLPSDSQRHALVLQSWEAINSERELNRVLAAIAEVLVPVVPFFGVAIIVIKGRQGSPWAMHVVGSPTRDHDHVFDPEARARSQMRAQEAAPEKELIPYEELEFDTVFDNGKPYVCDDILKKDRWWPWEFKLNAAGVRAYTSIPLTSRGSPIGVELLKSPATCGAPWCCVSESSGIENVSVFALQSSVGL